MTDFGVACASLHSIRGLAGTSPAHLSAGVPVYSNFPLSGNTFLRTGDGPRVPTRTCFPDLAVYCFRQIKRRKVLVVDFLLRGSSGASPAVPA